MSSDQPLADLQVEKSTEGSLFPADGPLVFAMSVRNAGEGAAQAVRLRDVLPARTTYRTDTSGTPVATLAGELVRDLGTLEPGASQSFHLLLSHRAASGDTLHNQVSVEGCNEGDTSNNSASADAEFLRDNNSSAPTIVAPGRPCQLFLPVLIRSRR